MAHFHKPFSLYYERVETVFIPSPATGIKYNEETQELCYFNRKEVRVTLPKHDKGKICCITPMFRHAREVGKGGFLGPLLSKERYVELTLTKKIL